MTFIFILLICLYLFVCFICAIFIFANEETKIYSLKGWISVLFWPIFLILNIIDKNS